MSFFKKLSNRVTTPKANLSLQLADSYAVLGETLEGSITVLPQETIDAEEVRCEINCTETAKVLRNEYDPVAKHMVTRQITERNVLYQVKPVCCSATQLVNGVSRCFKFSIDLPAGARPTFISVDNSVQWEIKAVVAVHGRPDVTTDEIQLQVITQSQKPVNAPLKIRLVNCEYCQTAMPETTLACPNCGARRKT
jgi:hypothetical protein